MLLLLIAVAVVGLAPSCTRPPAGEETQGSSNLPRHGISPIPQFTAGPSDNHSERQHQALSQEASIPPGLPGHALRVTIFLLSVPRFACLDMVSTAQRRLASRRHSPDPRPQQTPIQPSRGPSASGTTGPASPRLRSLARSTMGLVVRPTKVRLQHPTVLPEVPPIIQRALLLPESLGLRPGCAILAARWHPHLMIFLIVHSVSLFPSPTTGSERLRIPLSRLGLGKSLF